MAQIAKWRMDWELNSKIVRKLKQRDVRLQDEQKT